MKYSDLELEEPITGDLYQVQVKSSAAQSDFVEYATSFAGRGFRKLYFIVHSPLGRWDRGRELADCELILPEQLAEMVVDLGLVDWLQRRVK